MIIYACFAIGGNNLGVVFGRLSGGVEPDIKLVLAVCIAVIVVVLVIVFVVVTSSLIFLP